MLRALLILSALVVIVSTQSFDKGFRTVIHSSFPIDAPLRFDPNNDERLVLSIVKPSSDVSFKADDKHRLRIINIDHNLAQKNPRSNRKRTQPDSKVSVSARLTNQDESKPVPETKILVKQPVIDYGLPKINLEDISSFAASPGTKFISQKLGDSEPVNSRLFVSKMPRVEELLQKGYVLTDIYPLEFTADESEFEFPTDRFQLPPNNVDSQLRPPEKSLHEFQSVLTSGLLQKKNESQPTLQTKISSINTDEVPDVTVRPLEVKYNFLPKTNQAGFHSGKKYISKFLMSPAVAYEIPGTERERLDIRRTPGNIKNKQGIKQPVKEENAETNFFASLASQSIDEAKTQGKQQTKYTLPSKDKDKNALITSLFGDSTAESEEDVKSRLASLESGNLQNTKAKLYENAAANEKGALTSRVSATSGIESQTSGLLSSTNLKNSNDKNNFDIKTPAFRQELKEYSVPSVSNEESIFSSKLSEASEVKGSTFSSSSISNFQKQSSVKTETAFSSKFGAEGIASSARGTTQYVAEKNSNSKSAGLNKPEGFAIYYKKPSSPLQGKLGIQKSHEYSRMPFWYSAVPKSDPKELHPNDNLPYKAPNEPGNVKYVASYNIEEKNTSDLKSGDVIKSLEGFLKPEEFAIYYKTPVENSESLPTRYGVPRSYEYSTNDAQDQHTHSFLGLSSIPTSSHELFQTNSDIYSALHIPGVVQSNSPVSAGYELPILNSDTTPIFITASDGKHLENSVSIIYQPSSADNVNVTPPSTSYGTLSPSLSSNIDVGRETKLINKPFAEYGPPTTVKPSTTSRPLEDNEKLDIDIRTIPDSRIVLLKPPLDYGTPNVASSIRTPSGYLTHMKQRFEEKTYEFGVPVLKAPNTRPLSSYEVPIY